MSSNAVSDPAQNFKTDRLDQFCTFCDCNIEFKTASLDSNCGIEVWNEDHPEHQMELKWSEYKTKDDE